MYQGMQTQGLSIGAAVVGADWLRHLYTTMEHTCYYYTYGQFYDSPPPDAEQGPRPRLGATTASPPPCWP